MICLGVLLICFLSVSLHAIALVFFPNLFLFYFCVPCSFMSLPMQFMFSLYFASFSCSFSLFWYIAIQFILNGASADLFMLIFVIIDDVK